LKTAQEMKFLTIQSENILNIEDDYPKQGADPSNLTKERVIILSQLLRKSCQSFLSKALKSLAIADDILITGLQLGDTAVETGQDHDQNLIALLDQLITFKHPDVQFIGHCLTKDGLKPDPAQVQAILNMKKPDDVASVQTLIGMVKYLSKFLVDLSQICFNTSRVPVLTNRERAPCSSAWPGT